jgi:hypothetical protein
MAPARFGRHVPRPILGQPTAINAAELQERGRTMHNQHAGLSQTVADQRIAERRKEADHARLASGVRPPRRSRRWTERIRWRLAPRWLSGATDQPADRPHSAS